MKLKVDFEILDLYGKPLEKKANEYLGTIMIGGHEGDSMRKLILATEIQKSESININESDVKFIEDTIKATSLYNHLVKGAILKEIENQKVLSKKKD
ncbi:hypothetical protein KAR91_02225 [Candidatus Pacearchaeota archaeon]|nr:hypothetical protein [Candidatus Pacearchaeota archaeon]